jgi:heme exporter protein A
MLARLAIAPRQIWLLDEPLTALDQQGRALIDTLAQQHLARGGMILAASHEALGFATQQLNLTREAVR